MIDKFDKESKGADAPFGPDKYHQGKAREFVDKRSKKIQALNKKYKRYPLGAGGRWNDTEGRTETYQPFSPQGTIQYQNEVTALQHGMANKYSDFTK